MTDDLLTDSYLYILTTIKQSRITRLKSYEVEQYDERSLLTILTHFVLLERSVWQKTFPIKIMVEVHNLL
jgi:hypothetical protein